MIDLSAFDGSAEQIKVDDGECLYCYLLRMLDAFGCGDGGHRFTKKWIESQRTRHGWVLGWVCKRGGFCDCEVTFNVFRDDRDSERHRQLRCAASYLVEHPDEGYDDDDYDGDGDDGDGDPGH